jgi:hypothetical protein
LRKAAVRLVNPQAPRTPRTTATDGDGRYTFTQVAAGTYAISAARPGYLEMVRGARQPGATSQGTLLTVIDGQKLENISWSLPRAGVISGTVLDEFGDPAFNVPVRAFRFYYQNGRRDLTSGGNGTTDDRGMYRIAGLLPGEYLVSAVPNDTVARLAAQHEMVGERMRMSATPVNVPAPSAVGYVNVFYPDATLGGGASPVRVGASEDVPNVNLRLQVLETATVTGAITSAEGVPQTRLQLIDASAPLSLVGIAFRDMRPDGTFSFGGVAPGSYIVKGFGTPGGKPGMAGGEMWGSAEVIVGPQGGNHVTLQMRRGVTIAGRIKRETLPAGVDVARLRVRLDPVLSVTDWEMGPAIATPDADGAFSMRAVLPAHYRVTVTGGPEGTLVASAMLEEKDAADLHVRVDGSRNLVGLEIVLAPRLADITGLVTTAQGAPAPAQSVIVFPTDRALWLPQSRRIRQVQPGPDGRYSVRGLPAGEYRLATVLDPEAGRLSDPEYLAHLYPVASAVTIGAGATVTHDLRVR